MISLCSVHNKKYHYYSPNSNSLKCIDCKESCKESDLIPINNIVEKKYKEIEKIEKKLNYFKHDSINRENINMNEDELKVLFESVLCTQEVLSQGQEEMTSFLKTCGIQLAKDVISAKSFTSKEIVNKLSDDIMIIKQNLKDFMNMKDYRPFLNSLNNFSLVTYNCEETLKHFKLIESIFIDKKISSNSFGQFFNNLNSKAKSVIEKALQKIEIKNFLDNSKNNCLKNKFRKQGNPKRIIKSNQEVNSSIEKKSPIKKIKEIVEEKDERSESSGKSENSNKRSEIKKKRMKPFKSSERYDEDVIGQSNQLKEEEKDKEKEKEKNKRSRGRPKKIMNNEKVITIEDESDDEYEYEKASSKKEDNKKEGITNENSGNKINSKGKVIKKEQIEKLDKNIKDVCTTMKKKKLILFTKPILEEKKCVEPINREKKDENFEQLEKIEFNNTITKSEAQKASDHKLSESMTKIMNSSESGAAKLSKLYQLLKENLNVYKLIFNFEKKLNKCPYLLTLLSKITKVQKISFEEIKFKDTDMETLFRSLEANDICHIKFEDCKIESIKNIVSTLEKSNIQILTFKSCKFKSDLSVQKTELESFFKESKTLLCLKIKSCKFSDEFSETFAKGISENSTLKVLDLSGNYFTSEGLLTLFKGFEKNNSVEKIIMKLNKIDFDNVRDKLEGIVENRAKELKLVSD